MPYNTSLTDLACLLKRAGYLVMFFYISASNTFSSAGNSKISVMVEIIQDVFIYTTR